MSPARKAPSAPDATHVAYERAIHLTNVSGLATREHYEIAFAGLGRETREEMCGQVVFALALRQAGVPMEGIIEVGTYPPDVQLPPQVRRHLEDMAEVVDATGTQVLEMRNQGAPGADRFTIGARQEYGIWMVAFGDIEGTRVRGLAWAPNGDGWKVSTLAQEQATRHGWPRANYEHLQADVDGLLPAPDSQEIADLTAGRPVAPTDDGRATPWITYAEMADLITR